MVLLLEFEVYKALRLIDIYSPHSLPVCQDLSSLSCLPFNKIGCSLMTVYVDEGLGDTSHLELATARSKNPPIDGTALLGFPLRIKPG